MKEKLNWEVYSNEDRHKAIEEIKHAITANDGYILNFNLFSDLALSLTLEIEENRIIDLYDSLNGICKISTLEFENPNKRSTREWLIFLNISFNKGGGNLKIEIPDVPG